MTYLDKINNPDDLKKLSLNELKSLGFEIRDFIESVVFKTGGHLSSNLGVIDLSIALHYVFNLSREDKVIFDVSHQSYPHKIITGRRDNFHTLRQKDGITGFTNPKESKADAFVFGHAGTAISTSLGIATAKRLKKEKGKTIAVVGDAALGAGMSFEALNHAGHLNENIIVILNDNGMSISKSTGSFAKYLNKIRLTNCYQEVKEEIMSFVTKIPKVGKSVKGSIENLAERIKHRIGVNGYSLFKELSFNYFGPIDGHDIPLLLHTLRIMQNFTKPVLLHVITDKGKGNIEAMNNPEKFHGIAPSVTNKDKVQKETNFMDPKTTEVDTKLSFTKIFSNSLIDLAQQDESIIAITAAMPGGTGLDKFRDYFPERFFDVGICEQHAIGFAAGQSLVGLKPVCAIYSTFIQRAYDQIFQEVCLNERPVILANDRAGIVGEDGATHAGVFDISFLRCLPNIVLMSPKDGAELKAMLAFALKSKSPVSIRFPRDKSEPPDKIKDDDRQAIKLGKGEILKLGSDLVLVGYGPMAITCLEASYLLEEEGITATVINPRFAKPIDKELVGYALGQKSTIITVEDHSTQGGFGSCFLEEANKIATESFKLHIHGVPDKFVEHGTRQEILRELELDARGISTFAKNAISKEKAVNPL